MLAATAQPQAGVILDARFGYRYLCAITNIDHGGECPKSFFPNACEQAWQVLSLVVRKQPLFFGEIPWVVCGKPEEGVLAENLYIFAAKRSLYSVSDSLRGGA